MEPFTVQGLAKIEGQLCFKGRVYLCRTIMCYDVCFFIESYDSIAHARCVTALIQQRDMNRSKQNKIRKFFSNLEHKICVNSGQLFKLFFGIDEEE